MSIRTKILLLILIVVFLTGCVGTLIGRTMARDSLKNQINAQLVATAQAKSHNIQNMLDRQKEILRLLDIQAVADVALSQAGGFTQKTGMPDYTTIIGSLMSNFAMSSQQIREAIYLDSSGRVVTTSYTGLQDSFRGLDLSKIDFGNINFSVVDWSKIDLSEMDFSQIDLSKAIDSGLDLSLLDPRKAPTQDPRMRDQSQTDFSQSPIYLNGKEGIFIGDIKLQDDSPSFVLAVAQPFFVSGQLAGVMAFLGGEDLLSEIAADREGLGDTGEVYILNQDGFMLTPSRFIGGAVLTQQVNPPQIRDENGHVVTGNPALTPEPVVTKNYMGAKVISTYQQLPDTGWTVVVEKGYGEAFDPVSDLTRNMFWVLLGSLALGAFAALFFSRMLSGPIIKLRHSAEQIMQGNWNYSITTSRDEVGDLSKAFGNMASTLQKTQEELQDYTASLESKVEQRTQELSTANTQLQQASDKLEDRVEERTWELLEANNDLLTEIEERKQIEEKLRESETKYRAIVENSLIGIGINNENKIVYANQALLKIYGYADFEEFASKPLSVHLTPESREYYLQRRQKKAAGEAVPTEFEISAIRKDGEIRILRLSSTYVTIDDQIYAYNTFIDVTESKRMEEALQESEKRYRRLADNATDMIWTLDMNLRWTHISPSVTKSRGYTVEEAMAQSLEEAVTPQSLQMLMEIYQEELQLELSSQEPEPRGRVFELEQYCKDGSTIWTQSHTTFLRGPEGHPVGVIGVTRDITERKKAEEKLRESEEKLRRIFDSMTDGIMVSGMDSTILDVNDQWLEMHGVSSRDRILGRNARQFIVSPGPEALERMIAELDTTETLGNSEFTILKADGTSFPAEVSMAVLRDVSGNPVGRIGIIRDITERKRAQQELQRSEERYRELIDSSIDAVICIDDQMKILVWNQSATRIFGYTREEILGQSLLQIVPQRYQQAKMSGISQFMRTGVGPVIGRVTEIEGQHKDGSLIPVELSVTSGTTDHSYFATAIIRDITERKRTEQKLKLTQFAIDRASIGCWWIDSEGRVFYVNDQALSQ
ncbi:MAG: PAS domain S-box protein [Dehalococcoidia bacterium]|nr:PAS domain S-box protein [Dehalococcoidia bacterium]